MNRKWVISGIIVDVALLLTACSVLRGSGDVVNEERHVSGFERVDVDKSGVVVLTQGNQEALTVETDENIMPYVITEVRGGTLYLSLSNAEFSDISPSRLTFHLTVDDLTGLTVSGSAIIEASNLEVEHLTILIDGSGEVNLEGEVARQAVEISGSGRYNGRDLAGETVEISLDGSSYATVWPSESLVADVSGSAIIDYYGDPETSISVSGSGHINSLGGK